VLRIPLVGENKGHPAVFPVDLPRFFIKLLCPPQGIVADPFAGSGTTGVAAAQEDVGFILIDNNLQYCEAAYDRILKDVNIKPDFLKISALGKRQRKQLRLAKAA
jgi:DNA modification methylase